MRAVIISAGTVSDLEYIKGLIENDDLIICADGGLNHCRALGLSPDLIVGDFDSFTGELMDAEAETLVYPREKDYTDTSIALNEGIKRGADSFIFVGCSGTRLDHTLANIGLLEAVRRMGCKATLIDANNIMYAAQKHEVIRGHSGMNISFIPIEPVKGLTLKGFKYPLNKADIDLYETLWVSNVLEGEVGEVSFESGALLVDIYRE